MQRVFNFITTFPQKYRDIFVIILAYSIFSVGGSLFWAAIPILGEGVFMLSTFYVGLIMASIGVIYIFSDGPIGIILDYIGYKKGAIIGVVFALITALISIIQPPLPLFFTGIIFFALSWNILTHAVSAYILYSVPHDVEGRVFGVYGSLYNTGSLIATFFLGYVARWGFLNVGIFFLLLSILSLFFLIFLLRPEKRNYNDNFKKAIKSYLHGPSQWKRGFQAMKEFSPISWVAAMDGFVGYVFSSTIWFVIPLSLSLFANPFLPEGSALGIFEISGIIFVALGGYLADRYSRKKIFLYFLFFEIFTTIAIGYAPNLFIFLIFAFLTMAADDALSPSIDAMLAQVDKNHDKDGTIYGFVGIFTDLGFIVGPIAGGLLLDSFGLKGVFIFLGIMLFIDWAVSAILLRKFEGETKEGIRRKSDFYLGGEPLHRQRI